MYKLVKNTLNHSYGQGIVARFFIILFIFTLGLTGVSAVWEARNPDKVEAAVSSNLNYQARLLNSSGNVVPDGYYNIEFKLYDGQTGGNNLWTERYHDTNGATSGGDNRVRVVNGYLSVNLGSITPFPSMNWDQDLWMTMNVGGSTQTATPTFDGEMSPRIKLTAVPYAFQAKSAEQLAKTIGGYLGSLQFPNSLDGNTIYNLINPGAAFPNVDICLSSGNCAGSGGGLVGGGTAGRLSMFTSANGLGNSYLLQGSNSLTIDSNVSLTVDTDTLVVDAANNRLGVGTATPAYKLDVVSSDAISARFSGRVIGADAVQDNELVTLGQLNDAIGGSAGNYIANGTSLQTNANLAIQSAGDSNVTAAFRARASQSADILQVQNSTGNRVFSVNSSGRILFEEDVNLYKGGSNLLSTDNDLSVGGHITNLLDTNLTNMARNGSVEGGLQYWGATNSAGSDGAVSVYTDDSYFGSSSLRYQRSTFGSWAVLQHRFFDYLPTPYFDTNKTYTMSFYAKSLSGSPTLMSQINNASFTSSVGCNKTTVLSSSWQKITCKFTPSITGNQSILYMSSNATPSVDILIDGLMLTTGGQAFGYSAVQADKNDNVYLSNGLSVAGTITSVGTLYAGGNGVSITDPNGGILKGYSTSGTVNQNDVVVMVNNGGVRVATSTTPRDVRIVGTFKGASGATSGSVAIAGHSTVNATSGAVSIGDQLVVSGEAGRVMVDNNATAGILGYATTAKAAGSPGLIGVRLAVVNGASSPYSRISDFRLQNTTGTTDLFRVDGVNNRVAIGPNAIPANGVLTVGTNTTDVTGGMYFGTDTNLYRSMVGSSSVLKSNNGLWLGLGSGPSVALQTTGSASDTQPRFQMLADGSMRWGSGASTYDVSLYRDPGGNKLEIDKALNVVGTLTQNGTQVCLTSGNCAGTGGNGDVLQGGNSFGVPMVIGTNNAQTLSFETNGSTVATFNIAGQLQLAASGVNGGIIFGNDNEANLYRSSASVLSTSASVFQANRFKVLSDGGNFDARGADNGGRARYISGVTGDANSLGRFYISAVGTLNWGNGTDNPDVNLYRPTNGVNTLRTNGTLSVDNKLVVGAAVAAPSSRLVVNDSASAQGGWANTAIMGISATATTASNALILHNGTSPLFQVKGNGFSSVGAGAMPANGILTVGTNTTDLSGGIYFGTDTNLYRSGNQYLRTNGSFQIGGSRLNLLNNAAELTFGAASDTNLYRWDVGSLRTDGALDVIGALTQNGNTVCTTVGNCAGMGGNGDILQGGNAFDADVTLGTTNNYALNLITNGNIVAKFTTAGQLQLPVQGDTGGLVIGGDATLYRSASNTLRTDSGLGVFGQLTAAGLLNSTGSIIAQRTNTTDRALDVKLISDAGPRLRVTANGSIAFGDGGGTLDTNLYRSTADVLRTSDSFMVDGKLAVGTAIDNNVALNVLNTVSNPGAAQHGVNSDVVSNQTAANANSLYGVNGRVTINGTGGNTGIVSGINGRVNYGNSGVGTNINGGSFYVSQLSGGGGLSHARGLYTRVDNSSTNAIANAYGLAVANNTGTGSITNNTGIRIDSLTATDRAYGIQIAAPSAGLFSAAINLADTTGSTAGGILFGSDTNLYRSGVNILATDDSFSILGTGSRLYIQDAASTSVIEGNLTLNGTLTVRDFNRVQASTLSNTYYTSMPHSLTQSPMARSWHDIFAFNRLNGTPTFEQSPDGSTWSAPGLNSVVFAQTENGGTNIVDGTVNTSARYTWNSGNLAYATNSWGWLVLKAPYTSTVAASKTVLVESSADGVTWTSRANVSGINSQQQAIYMPVQSWGSHTRLRVTITSTNGQPIVLSGLQMLTDRVASQGGGREYEIPYTWDASMNLTVIGTGSPAGALRIGVSNTTSPTNGLYFSNDVNLYRSGDNVLSTDDTFNLQSGTLRVGGTDVITAGRVLQNVTANASILNAGTLDDNRLNTRIRTVAATITDWNTAVANGWYMGNNAANAPGPNWYMGEVQVHNASYVTQTVHNFAGVGLASNTQSYRRHMQAGVWGTWYKLQISQAEQDARYIQSSTLDGYVQLQSTTPGTAQTGNINVTGTITGSAFSGSGASLTNLNASSITTGKLDNARLNDNVAILDRNSQTFTGNNQIFRNAANSATAFSIQNSGSETLFNADTLNQRVSIGDAVSNARLTVSGSADPWVYRTPAEQNSWRSIAYGNGTFVAVSDTGTNQVMTSSDGITWTPRAAAEANWWNSITYGNGLFVAVSSNGTNRVMTSPDGITWTARSTPSGIWNSITYGNGLFVAMIGSSGNPASGLMTSPDGINWTARAIPSISWDSITYGNGLFVAVGLNKAMTSPDGITWTNQVAPAGSWDSITYGNGKFVAVGHAGTNASKIMTSSDGITWTHSPPAKPNDSWSSVTYGNGKFVAVGIYGDAMTSSDGITWTQRTAIDTSSWQSIAYGNGTFVAVASSGSNRVMTYSGSYGKAMIVNGDVDISGTIRQNGYEVCTTAGNCSGAGNILQGGNSFGSVMVLGTNDNFDLQFRTNGVTALTINSAGNATFNGTVTASSFAGSGASLTNLDADSVTTGELDDERLSNNVVLLNRDNQIFTGNDQIFRGSGDSETAFSIQNSGSETLFNADTLNQRINIGTSLSNARLTVSGVFDDASVWTSQSPAEENPWSAITYGKGTFVAISQGGTNRVMTSPDGITWTARTAASASQWTSVTYGNGVFVAISMDSAIMTSPDGITWTARTAAALSEWFSVSYGNGMFVAVSASSTNQVMTSPDGITWTSRTVPEVNRRGSVTYGNGTFVAVSYDGTNRVMTSPDGVNWTSQTAASANGWLSVTYGNGTFVAVSYDGTNRVMTSPDGVNWTSQTAASANDWRTVTYGNGHFVALSQSGTNRVMTSPDGVNWSSSTASSIGSWTSVTYGNGLFAAVASTGNIMTSPGGYGKAMTINGDMDITGTIRQNGYEVCTTAGNCKSGSSAMGDILQNGNSFGQAMVLGTNDNNELRFETAGTTRLTISNVGTATFSSTISTTGVSIGSGVNLITTNGSNQLRFAGTARNTKKIVLTPEYAGGVLDGTGLGTMKAGFDSTRRENYYVWTTTEGSWQEYSVVITMAVPSDWSSWAASNSLSINAYTNGAANAGGNVTVTGTTGTVDINAGNTTPNGVWQTYSFNLNNARYTADGMMTIRLKMGSQSGGIMQLGNINLTYLSQY